MKFRGSKLLSSPAIRVGKPVVSNRVIGAMPDRPWTRDVQNSSAVFPTGVTAPTPVMTTRGALNAPASAGPLDLFLDVADGVPDRGDLLGVLVRDLEAELL